MKDLIINNPQMSFLISLLIGMAAGIIVSRCHISLAPVTYFFISFILCSCVFSVLCDVTKDDLPFSEPPEEVATEKDLEVFEQ